MTLVGISDQDIALAEEILRTHGAPQVAEIARRLHGELEHRAYSQLTPAEQADLDYTYMETGVSGSSQLETRFVQPV